MTAEQIRSVPGRPLEELRDSGLLWLINRVVFHPRGRALALHFDGEGRATGWSLQGDGTEPWTFEDGPEQTDAFARAEATMRGAPGVEDAVDRMEALIQHADDNSVRSVRAIRAALAPQARPEGADS